MTYFSHFTTRETREFPCFICTRFCTQIARKNKGIPLFQHQQEYSLVSTSNWELLCFTKTREGVPLFFVLRGFQFKNKGINEIFVPLFFERGFCA